MSFKSGFIHGFKVGTITALIIIGVFLISTKCNGAPVPQPITISFVWPGNDTTSGICAGIDFRYSNDSTALINNWNNQNLILIDLNPKIAGTADSVMIDTLFKTNTLYFIAAKAFDYKPNYSTISNIARLYVDKIAPGAVLITIKLR